MTGGEACVDGQLVEPGHVRPLAVDEEDGGAVGGRLEHDRGDEKRSRPPVPKDREAERNERYDDRDHDAARDLGAEERQVVPVRRPVVGEPLDDVFVGVVEPGRQDELGEEQPNGDRGRGQQRVAGHHEPDEHCSGVVLSKPVP